MLFKVFLLLIQKFYIFVYKSMVDVSQKVIWKNETSLVDKEKH